MVEVTKNLENRHQALKWMYSHGTTGFLGREIIEKFHIPPSFLSACTKKNLIRVDGKKGSRYIGGEPNLKLAVEMYDFENQRLGRKTPLYADRMMNLEGLNKYKGVVAKALNSQIEKENLSIENPIKSFTSPELIITISNNKVSMDLKDFIKLIDK